MGRGSSGLSEASSAATRAASISTNAGSSSGDWFTPEFREKAERDFWQKKGNTVSDSGRNDMEFAIGMMRGTKYDSNYPKESRESVELLEDLKFVNGAKTRSEFVSRGRQVKQKWDRVLKTDTYYSDGERPPWGNPYREFTSVLEREEYDKKQYDKYAKGGRRRK